MVAADVQPYAGVADLLKTQLRAVGVELTVDKEPLSTLVSSFLFGRNYQMALTPSIDNGPDPDQYSLWHSGQGTDTFDLAHFQRQVFIDKDLEDGRATPIRPERKVAYDDFQTLVADAAPAIFLYEPHYGYAIANRVHGVRTNPTIQPVDRFEYVTQWYIPSGI
jgi:peptide/nickel transport system substrate-binding protein